METSVAVRCSWRTVGEVKYRSGQLEWPSLPEGAGVYRFVLTLGNRTRVYVGETELSGGQETSLLRYIAGPS